MTDWARQFGPWSILGGALLLGYLPHFAAYAANLMEREHYHFFPLAWLGAAALLWVHRETLKPKAKVSVPALGWIGVILAALTLAAAGVLNSSWLAMASVVPMSLGLAWLVGGWETIKGITPALIMFVTTLRPPGNIDTELILNLRSLAVRFSSRILDLVGVVHVPWGSVIRVPGGELMVDEACSGINSLVSVLAIITFLGLFLRRPALHLMLLLVGSVGIVILVNVMRVSIVTVAYTRWEIDLLKGWKHDALGMALYAVSLGLAASLDQLLLLLGSMIPRRLRNRNRAAASFTYGTHGEIRDTRRLDDPLSSRIPQDQPSASTHLPRLEELRRRWLAPAVALFLAIALITPARWAYGALISKDRSAEASHLVSHADAVISEGIMPSALGQWERIGFAEETREAGNPFGMRSQAWRFRLGDREAMVSLDYPFRGWHELIGCYESIDWKLRGRAEAQDSNEGPYVTASLDRSDGQFAHLLFGFFDDRGLPVEPPSQTGLDIASREMPWELVPKRPNYQIQVFCTSFAPLGDEERQHLADLFEASRRQLHEHLFASGAITP